MFVELCRTCMEHLEKLVSHCKYWCTRSDSNARPTEPESVALSSWATGAWRRIGFSEKSWNTRQWKGSSGELKNQEYSLLVRGSFLPKAISCHPKGRLVRRMISASRKRILFESFEHSFFSCFDLKPLPNLEIKFYPDFKMKIPYEGVGYLRWWANWNRICSGVRKPWR